MSLTKNASRRQGEKHRAAAPLFLALLLPLLAAGCLGGETRLPADLEHQIYLDDSTGWTVHELAAGVGTDRPVRVRICPAAGGNAYSLRVGGVELLRQPPSLEKLRGVGFGIPLLYPTPNRVRGGKFSFEGRKFEFPVNGSGNHMHGLVHSLEWKEGDIEVGEDSLTLPIFLDIEPGHPVYERFAFKHRVEVRYTVSREGLRISLSIENRGTRRIPLGFALHPWFRAVGGRDRVRITVPARKHMAASRFTLLPSGVLEDLDGSARDLRAPVSLASLDLDDVYWGMRPEKPASCELLDPGLRVTLEASEIFTHMVVYTPPGEDYFCLESQTCSTDAHNLYAKGREFAEAAHLLILEPMGGEGSRLEGSVQVRVEPIGATASRGRGVSSSPRETGSGDES